MKAKSLLFLFLISVGVLSYVYFAIEKPAKLKESGLEKDGLLAPGKLDTIKWIRVTTADKKVELERQTIGWRVLAPEKDLASQSKIENIISALEKFKKSRVLLEPSKLSAQKPDLSQYGLQPPRLTVEYKTADLPDPVTLSLGQANPSGNATYAKTDKEGLVMATMELDSLATQNADEFREMRFTTVAASDFDEVEYQWKGRFAKFKRDANGWSMLAPFSLPVDQDFTKSFMDKIGFVRANKFVTTGALNFDKPDIKIIVGFSKDVKDLRSTESDPRPQGMELRLVKIKRPRVKEAKSQRDSKPSQDEFDYFAKGDKTSAGSIAQFHYDNFTKAPEDFIKKTFDNFLSGDVESIKILSSKETEVSIAKSGESFKVTQGKESLDGDSTKITKWLDQVRGLRANLFLDVPKAAPKNSDLRIELGLKNKRTLNFAFELQKNSSILWFTQDGRTLKYAFPKEIPALKDLGMTAFALKSEEKKP